MSDWIELVNSIAQRWSSGMWLILWQSTVLAAIVFLLAMGLRKVSAGLRFWLWMLVPLRLVIMPLVTVSLPLLPAQTPAHESATSPVITDVMPDQESPEVIPSELPFVETGMASSNADTMSPEVSVNPANLSSSIQPNIHTWLLVAWLAGAGFFAIRLICGWTRIRRLMGQSHLVDDPEILAVAAEASQQMGLRFVPRLVACNDTNPPFTMGVFHPVVALPASLIEQVSSDELLTVLSHEFAHIRRRDSLIGWFLGLCEVLYYFHPVFHLAKRQSIREREQACDEIVLASRLAKPGMYAQALINAAASCRNPHRYVLPVAAVAESFGDLKKRVTRICSIVTPKARLSKTSLISLVMLMIISLPGIVLTARSAAKTTDDVTATDIQTAPAPSDAKTSSDQAAEVLKEMTQDAAKVSKGGDSSGEIDGILKDHEGKAVQEAEVIIVTRSANRVIRDGKVEIRNGELITQTNASGAYSFAPPSEDYAIVVLNEDGFACATDEQLADSADLTLEPWGRIEGVWRYGTQLANLKGIAAVATRPQVTGSPGIYIERFVRTNEDGKFVIEQVPPGEVRVSGNNRGERVTGEPTSFPAMLVDVLPGQTAHIEMGGHGRPVVGQITLPANLEGQIDWSYGVRDFSTPFIEVAWPEELKNDKDIFAWRDNYYLRGPGKATRLDRKQYGFGITPDGRFRIENVLPGKYKLEVGAHPRRESGTSAYGEKIGRVEHEVVVPDIDDTEMNTPFDLGKLELEPVPTKNAGDPIDVAPDEVAGRVIDNAGKPIEGVKVTIYPRFPSKEWPIVSTDANGIFRIQGFGNSHYTYVEIEAPDLAVDWITDLPVGQGFTVKLDSSSRLSSAFVTPKGKPAGPTTVILTCSRPTTRQRMGNQINDIRIERQTNGEGALDIPIPPGTYNVQVASILEFYARFPNVEVQSGKTTSLPGELQPGVKFEAKVVDSVTGDPVVGQQIFIEEKLPSFTHPKEGSKRTTNSRGIVVWDSLMPGQTLFGCLLARGPYIRWWSEASSIAWGRKDSKTKGGGRWQRNIDRLPFDLQPDMPPVVITMEKGVKILGQVLSPDGDPVPEALVLFTGFRTGDMRYMMTTDKQGRFGPGIGERDWGGYVPAGKGIAYRLCAKDTEGKWYEHQGRWANAVSEPFHSQPGDELEFTLRMTKGGRVVGRVIDPDGKEVADIEVEAVAQDDLDSTYINPRTITDAQGRYTLGPMRAGTYRIQADADKGVNISQEPVQHSRMVTVVEGSETTAEDLTFIRPPGRDGR